MKNIRKFIVYIALYYGQKRNIAYILSVSHKKNQLRKKSAYLTRKFAILN